MIGRLHYKSPGRKLPIADVSTVFNQTPCQPLENQALDVFVQSRWEIGTRSMLQMQPKIYSVTGQQKGDNSQFLIITQVDC